MRRNAASIVTRHNVEIFRWTRSGSADMTTPGGCLAVLTRTLMRLARHGDVETFRAYVSSDDFLKAFTGLDRKQRRSALQCFGKAEALSETRHPLVKAGPIHARQAQKVNWSDPLMRAKLASAYARAGGDDEKAARILGVSLGSARLARKRHLVASTADR